MEHKKTKITMGVALVLCAVVALAGVSYALASYQGSAINQGNETDSETITVALNSYSGFLDGTFTLNTENNGTNVTLSGLEKDGSDVSGSLYTDKKFHYSSGFTLNTTAWGDGETHYSAYVVGSVTATIRQTTGASATTVTMSVSGGPASAVNQYGFSLVYVVNDTAYATVSDLPVVLSEGSASVTVTAYLVYSETVPTGSIASISAYTMTAGNITITASATDA